MLANLKGIFSREAIAKSLVALPILETTIMDLYFKNRPAHPMSLIGLADLVDVVQTVPVVRRDSAAVSLQGQSMDMQFIAPMPLKVKVNVSASELNDLRVIMGNAESVNAWRTAKINQIRRAVRDTTEAMCAVTLTTGKLSWPVDVGGGRRENYEVDYGAPLTFTPLAKLNATSKLSAVFNLLRAMEQEIKKAGTGGNVEFLAGADVATMLLDIAEKHTSTAEGKPLSVRLEQGQMQIGGYLIRFMDETYPDPVSGQWVPKLGAKTLQAVSVNAPGNVWYCAVDSISANNAAVPLHIVPVASDDDSGITLIGQAKPLPARASRATCLCTAVE